MKTKRSIAILLIFALLLSCFGAITVASAQTIIPGGAVGHNFAAKWIWTADDQTKANSWVAFRKTFNLAAVPSGEVTAWIAADTKYWLYINGQMIVFEGSVNRGPTLTDTYVDKVNIAPYLQPGNNTVAVLVDFYGKLTSGNVSYSYNTSGKGTFLFEADVDGQMIKSDSSWKAIKHAGYIAPADEANYRLAANINYDAAAAIPFEGWYTTEFNDSAWPAAIEKGSVGDAPWGHLWERPIPQWKDKGIKKYDVSQASPDVKISQTRAPGALLSIGQQNYVVETRVAVTNRAFGIVFADQEGNANNAYMWQFNCVDDRPADNPNGVPRLRPHKRSGGGWVGLAGVDLTNIVGAGVSGPDFLNRYIDLKFKLTATAVETYAKLPEDSTWVLVSTIADTSFRGGYVGIRKEGGAEGGKMDYLKVSTLDESTVIYYDDFNSATGAVNFSNGSRENGNWVFPVTSGAEFYFATGLGAVTASRYTIKLPTNIHSTPYIKVDSDAAGKVIKLLTNRSDPGGGENCNRAQYITKAGLQEYESLCWISGWEWYIDVPEGVTVKEIGYRQTGFNTEFVGSFDSNDAFMDKLWGKALDTLYVTMRDNFMDCPDRERANWAGDAVNEMEMAFYSLDQNANQLIRKFQSNVLEWVQNDIVPTVPMSQSFFELPAQSLATSSSFYMYYLYTGDATLLQQSYDVASKYLLTKYSLGNDGVIQHRGGTWNWSDWGDNCDQKLITNEWYYYATCTTLKIAEAAGITDSVAQLRARKMSIEQNFDRVFWKNGYYRTDGVTVTDDRGQSLAVFSGLASKDKYPAIKDSLKTIMYSSPYMEKYALQALYMMGYADEAVDRTKTRYNTMVADETPTLWEFWSKTASLNHAWTGGPLTMMSRYATGVAPIEAGYTKFQVIPQLGTKFTDINTRVPSVKGNIDVAITNRTGRFTLDVTAPAGTTAKVGVLRMSGPTKVSLGGTEIWNNGKATNNASVTCVGSDETYIYFEVGAGTWSFVSEDVVPVVKANYTLNVADNANGHVLVNGQPVSQITTYPAGTVLDVEAIANSGFKFASYAGTSAGKANPFTVKMDSDVYLDLNFEPIQQNDYSLVTITTTNEPSAFTIEVNGQTYNLPFSGVYDNGATINYKLIPEYADEYFFKNWSGITGSSDTGSFVVNGNTTATATFIESKPTNYAYQKTVTADRTMTSAPTWRVQNLVDGVRKGAGYTTNGTDGQTSDKYANNTLPTAHNTVINLGAAYDINRIFIYPRTDTATIDGKSANYPVDFTVWTSLDGVSYTLAQTVTATPNPMGKRIKVDFPLTNAKYVKITTTKTGPVAGDESYIRMQLAEIEVVNSNNGVAILDLASNSILEGTTTQLTATLRGESGTVDPSGATVTITSGNDKIATVDAAGLITAHYPGTTQINYKAVKDGITYQSAATLTVTAKAALAQYNKALGAAVSSNNIYNGGATWQVSNLTNGTIVTGVANGGYTSNTFPAASNITAPVTITLDLGAEKTFDNIALYPRTDEKANGNQVPNYLVDYKVLGSFDGTNWFSLKEITNAPLPDVYDPATFSQDLGKHNLRYVRVEISKLANPLAEDGTNYVYRVQLAEVALFEKGGMVDKTALDAALKDGASFLATFNNAIPAVQTRIETALTAGLAETKSTTSNAASVATAVADIRSALTITAADIAGYLKTAAYTPSISNGSLVLPTLPATGFNLEVVNTSPAGVIASDGTVTAGATNATVSFEIKVNGTGTDTAVVDKTFSILVPAQDYDTKATVTAVEKQLLVNDGKDVKFDINAGGFAQATGFQLAVSYDPTKIRVKPNAITFAQGIDGFLFGTTNTGGVYKTFIGVSAGVSVSSISKLFTLNFERIDGSEEFESQITLTKLDIATVDDNDNATKIDVEITKSAAPFRVVDLAKICDMNKSGSVTIADLSVAMKYYTAEQGDSNWNYAKVADVNWDGVVDMADLIIILSFID